MTYPRSYIAISTLVLLTLACGVTTLPVQRDQAERNPYSIPAVAAPLPYRTVTVTAYAVNIRDENGITTGEQLVKDTIIQGQIQGDWFVLIDGRKVWLGCVSAESDKGCEER